jgi:hypothetical protein
MARKKKLTPEVVAKIQARRRQGIPIVDIARETALSVGSVHKAIRMPPPDGAEPKTDKPGSKSPAKPARKKRAAKTAPKGEDLEVPRTEDGEPDLLAIVKGVAADLDELRRKAKSEGNAHGATTISRAMTTALALAAKLTPPPTENPEDAPDMLAAAEKCRKKLRDMLDRELARRSAA